MSYKVISGAPAVDGGDINIPTNIEFMRQFERVSYTIPEYLMPDMIGLIANLSLPGISIGLKSVNVMSYSVFKYPFIYSGDELFQFDGGAGSHGWYSINPDAELNIERPLFRFKFYVFMGVNNMMLDGTIYAQALRDHKLFYDTLGLNSGIEYSLGVTFHETSIGYIPGPELSLRKQIPLFWYLEENTLAEQLGGIKEEITTSDGKFEFVSDIRFGMKCFDYVYQSDDYKFTKDLELDKKMLVYNQINLFRNPNFKASTWAVEYAYPWGFLTINNDLKHLDVSLSCPILLNRNVVNVLSSPMNPIATVYRLRGGLFRDIGECIYFIFPLVERVK